MEFSNPHSWLYLEVKTEAGEVQEWAVEGAAPNALLRRGWNRNSLPTGTVVNVQGFQARDRSFRAAGRNVTLPDGKSLFVGSVGIGAPDEGAGGAASEGEAASSRAHSPALISKNASSSSGKSARSVWRSGGGSPFASASFTERS